MANRTGFVGGTIGIEIIAGILIIVRLNNQPIK
jgi:hypothetical protein